MFDVKAFLIHAEHALEAAGKLAPIAAALGVPMAAPAGVIVADIAAVAKAALERADDAEIALTTQDQAELTALVDRLNDLAVQEEADADAAEKAAGVE